MLAWLSVLSEVQICIWPSWCHCHSLSLAPVKSRLVLPFWYRLTWVVPEKGPLNGCVCVCVCVLMSKLASSYLPGARLTANFHTRYQSLFLFYFHFRSYLFFFSFLLFYVRCCLSHYFPRSSVLYLLLCGLFSLCCILLRLVFVFGHIVSVLFVKLWHSSLLFLHLTFLWLTVDCHFGLMLKCCNV